MFNNTCTKVHSAVHTVRKYLMSSFRTNKQGHKKSYIIEERGRHVGSDAHVVCHVGPDISTLG